MDYKGKYEQAIEALRSLFAEQAIKHCDNYIFNVLRELRNQLDELNK